MPVNTRPLHDTLRLGLPVAALVPSEDDGGAQAGLLVVAALLLAASGCGGLVVGISARRMAGSA